MLAPAKGERLIATGSVVKPGRTLSIVRADVHAIDGARETLVAAMQQTLMVMHGASDERI
jgi:acyl-coenzyme A thioesterase PaaI-like protein